MFKSDYILDTDTTITRWLLSEVVRTPIETPPTAFDAEINAGEAYVQIVYPVRKQFIAENSISQEMYKQVPCTVPYFAFEHDRVDLTDFIFTPHRLSVYGKTWLEVSESGSYSFELFTCGGVKLWLDGEEVVCFTPYTRNITSSYDFSLELSEGIHEIQLFADELAERDVFFYFGLIYTGTLPLKGFIQTSVPSERLQAAEQFLGSLSFSQDLYLAEAPELVGSYPPPAGVDTLFVESMGIIPGEIDSDYAISPNWVNPAESPAAGKGCIILDMAARSEGSVAGKAAKEWFLRLEKPTVFRTGVHEFFFSLQLSSSTESGVSDDSFVVITRKLVCAYDHQPEFQSNPEQTIEGRKNQVLTYLSANSVCNVNKALAILEIEKAFTPEAEASYRESLAFVAEKRDCSDFYLPSLLLILDAYGGLLPAGLREETLQAVLDYRYWIDEPGNDVMWFFSENHALMFHVSQYLAGAMLPDSLFIRSGRTGRAQCAVAKERLIKWFENFFRFGYAEWNSITYIPIDLIGFFHLFMRAPDAEIKAYAQKALDYSFKIFSLHNFRGVVSSSYGRTYESTLKARQLSEPSMLAFITDGTGFITRNNMAATLYCISSYRPGQWYEGGSIPEGKAAVIELAQGPNNIPVYTYQTHTFSMSSVINYHPFRHGHQQHIMNIALGDPLVHIAVNHPGEKCFSGGNRPSYWAGNGTLPRIYQQQGTMLMQYRIEACEVVPYIHMYLPLYAFDHWEVQNTHWLWIEKSGAYLGAYFSNGVEITEQGANRGKEAISYGRNHTVLLICGDTASYGSFQHFKELSGSAEMDFRDNGIRFADPLQGVLEILADGEFLCNGREVSYAFSRAPELEKFQKITAVTEGLGKV